MNVKQHAFLTYSIDCGDDKHDNNQLFGWI